MSEGNLNEQTNQNEQPLSELLQIRRDKLAALQEAGQDPFTITKYQVTHHSKIGRAHV